MVKDVDHLTVFSKLKISYTTSLLFASQKLAAKSRLAWQKNQDPTHYWLASCFSQDIEENNQPKVTLVSCGGQEYCVVATAAIGKYQLVGEYTGIVRKTKRIFSEEPYSVEYPIGFSSVRSYVIDAAKQGNFTRFFRHSDTPNLEMKKTLYQDGHIHILFFTKGFIAAGEELTLNYGKKPFFRSFFY